MTSVTYGETEARLKSNSQLYFGSNSRNIFFHNTMSKKHSFSSDLFFYKWTSRTLSKTRNAQVFFYLLSNWVNFVQVRIPWKKGEGVKVMFMKDTGLIALNSKVFL